jgi:hypothetical protein
MTFALSWTYKQHQLVHAHTFCVSYLAEGHIQRTIIAMHTSSSRLCIFEWFIKKILGLR